MILNITEINMIADVIIYIAYNELDKSKKFKSLLQGTTVKQIQDTIMPIVDKIVQQDETKKQ